MATRLDYDGLDAIVNDLNKMSQGSLANIIKDRKFSTKFLN